MTPTNNALPELPEMMVLGFYGDAPGKVVKGFTEHQMRAYGELCRASAGREAVAEETLRVFREMADKVHDMFFWRVSPDSAGSHKVSHEAVRAVVELCEEIEQSTPAYENLPAAPELPKQGEIGRGLVGDRALLLRAIQDEKATWTGDYRKAAHQALDDMLDRYDALAKKAEGV
jgi:hypothetical protein